MKRTTFNDEDSGQIRGIKKRKKNKNDLINININIHKKMEQSRRKS